MSTETLLGLFQFADGLFPAGGHAHSFGLESYVQAGVVRTRADLQAFLEALLEGSAGPCDAVAVVAAQEAAGAGDLAAALDLDARLDAMKPVLELRMASRQMGRQTLRAAVALTDERLLAGLWQAVESRRTPGHHPLVFGFVGHAVGSSPEASAAAYLHSTAAVVVAAALRLMPLGQVEGQRTLWSLRPLLARLAQEAAGKDAGDLWSFAPGIEIASMHHATLDGRLFRS